jgi:peptidoglycan/LPS O-acetylase OafA/YrhL
MFRYGFAVIALCSVVLVAAAHADDRLQSGHLAMSFTRLLTWRPLVWTGQRSYAIYLWHYPILVICLLNLKLSPLISGLCAAIGALLLSGLSYRWVESYFLNRRHRPARPVSNAIGAAAGAAGAVTIPLGLYYFFVLGT